MNIDNLDLEEKFKFIKDDPNFNKVFGNKIKNVEDLKSLLNNYKPLTSEEYLKDPKNIVLDKEGGIVIQSNPGFVIKAINKVNKEKIFLNVTSHPIIDKPEQKEIIQENEAQEALRIPMSVGNLREEFDHKKEPCKVTDLIINDEVILNLLKDKDMMKFFWEITKGYINQKFKINLQNNFIVLKNLKYKGSNVEFQRVKGKKNADIKVTDIKENNKKVNNDIKNISNLKDLNIKKKIKKIQPEFKLKIINKDNDTIEFDGFNLNIEDSIGYILEFELPLIKTGKFLEIFICNDEFNLFDKNFYEINLKLPLIINKDKVSSEFDCDKKTLSVNFFLDIEEKEDSFENYNDPSNILDINKKIIEDKNINLENNMLYDLF